MRRPQCLSSRCVERIWEAFQRFTLQNRRQPLTLPQSPGKAVKHLTPALPATLLEADATRNHESRRACEETVEDRNCLWKGMEKRCGISKFSFPRGIIPSK